MTDQLNEWNRIISLLPGAHFLQTREWAAVKRAVGWEAQELIWHDDEGKTSGAAQVLTRSMRLLRYGPRLGVGYVPRGPLINWNDRSQRATALDTLEAHAHRQNLVFIKIDPEVEIGRGVDGTADQDGIAPILMEELRQRGWRYSPEQIQFKNTMLIDLSGSEEDWLTRMKQKTRYNIRLAMKNGVTVRTAALNDLPMLYNMYVETANRDGFIIRPQEYYLDVWTRFMQAGMAEGLVAEYEGTPLAGLIYFHLGARAWYVYGMSKNLQREKMPNYLLQWEAMRAAHAKGCLVYDLWGAPDTFEPGDPMFGVYRFKDGLGAEVVRTIGAWDYPVKPALYFIYHQVLPKLLNVTRSIRRRQIKQETL
jgi:lipid II:glycine glycyltransferase (peptidoglycan interpeptide bridge formation enzyme)